MVAIDHEGHIALSGLLRSQPRVFTQVGKQTMRRHHLTQLYQVCHIFYRGLWLLELQSYIDISNSGKQKQ